MKVIKSERVSPFGGLNFVIKELDKRGVGNILCHHLPSLKPQCRFSWRDIFYSYWSVFLCGGDCAEDLSLNFKGPLDIHPDLSIPSPDRVLNRLKELAQAPTEYVSKRSSPGHFFAINEQLNHLNISICNQLFDYNADEITLDYDNTICFTDKKDASRTYKFENGYQPGVGFIGSSIVYVENRSGKSTAQVGQDQTLLRMFLQLQNQGIAVKRFRADSASYGYEMLEVINQFSDLFYLRARMSQRLEKAISTVKKWKAIKRSGETVYRGETTFTPFQSLFKGTKKAKALKSYRLIITKEVRRDGQLNAFTGEAYNYSAIVTNDTEMETDQIVHFYNQRGAIEKEFEVLKYDFGWQNLPFSYLAENNVYLLVTAMCRNIYHFLINFFSSKVHGLKPWYRIKKFIFRFICIPAKWVRHARQWRLKLYGNVAFKT